MWIGGYNGELHIIHRIEKYPESPLWTKCWYLDTSGFDFRQTFNVYIKIDWDEEFNALVV